MTLRHAQILSLRPQGAHRHGRGARRRDRRGEPFSLHPTSSPRRTTGSANVRTTRGVPILLDVASNLAFLVVGALGLGFVLRRRRAWMAAPRSRMRPKAGRGGWRSRRSLTAPARLRLLPLGPRQPAARLGSAAHGGGLHGHRRGHRWRAYRARRRARGSSSRSGFSAPAAGGTGAGAPSMASKTSTRTGRSSSGLCADRPVDRCLVSRPLHPVVDIRSGRRLLGASPKARKRVRPSDLRRPPRAS